MVFPMLNKFFKIKKDKQIVYPVPKNSLHSAKKSNLNNALKVTQEEMCVTFHKMVTMYRSVFMIRATYPPNINKKAGLCNCGRVRNDVATTEGGHYHKIKRFRLISTRIYTSGTHILFQYI